MKNIDLSIVIPVYNEEESLELLYNSIINNLENTNLNFEIIFIDDGSSDKSWDVIKTISEKKTNLSSIKFRKNYGKSDALDAGFKASNGKYVLTMDADLQDDPNEIYPLFKMINQDNYDLVSGWKKNEMILFQKLFPLNFLI